MRTTTYQALIAAVIVGTLAFPGLALADNSSGAQGAAVNSPGVGSGNAAQPPKHQPVNTCGNSANVIGLLNPARVGLDVMPRQVGQPADRW